MTNIYMYVIPTHKSTWMCIKNKRRFLSPYLMTGGEVPSVILNAGFILSSTLVCVHVRVDVCVGSSNMGRAHI